MSRFLKFLLILLLCIAGAEGDYAQKQSQALIDSLLQELPKQAADTNKVKILNDLSYSYYPINTDEGLKYGEQALELATQLEWKSGIGRANMVIGNNYLRKSDNPKALEYYQQALKINEETGNKKGAASVTSNIGLMYLSEGDDPKAFEYFSKALKMHEEIGNKEGIAIACDNIADIYKNRNDYARALEYYLKALDLFEEVGRKAGIASAMQSIGEVYVHEENYVPAIAYMKRAMHIDDEIGDKLGAALGLSNIGSAYLAMIRDTSGKDADNAKPAEKKYKKMRSAQDARKLDTAVDYLRQAQAKGEVIRALDVLLGCYTNLAEAYRLRGDYKRSLEYAESARAIKDSVFSKTNNDKIVKMEMNAEYEKKRQEAQKTAMLKLQRQKTFTYAGIAGILLLAGFSFFIIKERGKSEQERKVAETERKKSDDLLLNILPSEVAAELKAKGTTTAKYFDHVTVIFTDFVNFSNAGERMAPQSLIDELHNCFKAFDEITGKYNIEKIKTIGDAYLAVSGLPTANPAHAENIVRAAIEINQFMQARRAQMGDMTFEVRIGIHSGSVVAGIVGVKKFAYDIWGDTVNTAARMEQNSEAGKINISQTTYELVKDKFTCEYRGDIDAKNKGLLKMYFVS